MGGTVSEAEQRKVCGEGLAKRRNRHDEVRSESPRPPRKGRGRSILILVWLVFATASVLAQNGLDGPIQVSELKRLRDEVALQADTGDRDDLVKLYDQAIEAAERAKAFDKKVTDFDRQTQDAPTLLAALKEELAQPPAKDDPEFSLETTLREFEQFKQQSEAHRAAAQKLVDDLAGEAKHRTERQALLADEIARVGSLITQVESTLRGVSATDAVGTARQQALRWGLEALRAEDRALKAERAAYEARRETLPLRRDRAQRQLARAVFLTQFWEQRVADKRQQDAKQAVRDASAQRRATAARFPELEKFAKRNEEIAALSLGGQGILDQDVRAREALRQAESLLEEIKRRSRATRSKITVGGLTEGMGQLLRREYEWTRSASKLRAESEGRKDELSRAQLLQIDLQEDQDALRDLDDAQQKLVDSIEDTGPDSNTEELSALARELLETRAGLLPPRIDGLGKLINTLLDHERTHQQLVEETVAYRSYIEERILWVPSTAILIIPSTKTAREGFAWLTSASSWADALRKAESAVDRRLARYILAGLLLAFLVFYRRRMRRELVTKIDDVRATRQERYRLTLRAFALTWGLALPLPLVVHTAGLLLTGPRDQEEVARALGLALREVAFTFFVLEFLRQATKERHLAEMHLRWPSTSIGLLRSQLRWFLPVSLPLEVLSITFDRQSSTPIWSDTLGRIAFVALETALAVVMFRLLRPGAKLLAGHYRRRSSLLERSHALWSTLVVATPLALIGLALWGYYYSALQLQARLRDSLGLAIALLLINALLLRWLFVARGNLAIEQAKQRAQTRANAAGTTGEIAITESGILQAEEEVIDISSVDTQTRQVIRSGIVAALVLGLYFIWSGAFPAFRGLERVQLWPKFQVVDVEDHLELEAEAPVASPSSEAKDPLDKAQTAGNQPGAKDPETPAVPQRTEAKGQLDRALETSDRPSAKEAEDPITLANLALALLIIALTIIATRNAPGVLEITVLQRLPLDGGSRYALSSLFRYLILILGLTAGMSELGIGWDKIQWLAAALTFGLAFGLQEIFANFVSGIIILLERPVRVGDIVSLGDTEGRVTKLRMRSTTILDWDRRELLIPNKEFITGKVVNWTLSDPVTRVVIHVGIAYGSDTNLARSLLLDVAKRNELILADPPPSAIFRRFGDSSLDFDLRVYMGNRDLWPQVIDRLHSQIDDAFRAAKIEIAFPQRDLHIRSAQGLRANDLPVSEGPGSD